MTKKHDPTTEDAAEHAKDEHPKGDAKTLKKFTEAGCPEDGAAVLMEAQHAGLSLEEVLGYLLTHGAGLGLGDLIRRLISERIATKGTHAAAKPPKP